MVQDQRRRFALPEQFFLFAMGGAAYLAAELVWRGETHWTMFFAGGACFCLLVWLEARPGLTVAAGAAWGAAGITVLELAVGQACLTLLGVRVWDYRAEWADIAGFVCPKYTVLPAKRKGGPPYVCSVSQCLRPHRSVRRQRLVFVFCRHHGGSLAGALRLKRAFGTSRLRRGANGTKCPAALAFLGKNGYAVLYKQTPRPAARRAGVRVPAAMPAGPGASGLPRRPPKPENGV